MLLMATQSRRYPEWGEPFAQSCECLLLYIENRLGSAIAPFGNVFATELCTRLPNRVKDSKSKVNLFKWSHGVWFWFNKAAGGPCKGTASQSGFIATCR